MSKYSILVLVLFRQQIHRPVALQVHSRAYFRNLNLDYRHRDKVNHNQNQSHVGYAVGSDALADAYAAIH